jgi:pyroglutamyl-peptidase
MSQPFVHIVLTGFGKFAGVDDNPTSRLMEYFRNHPPALGDNVSLHCIDTLTVAGLDAVRFVKRTHEELERFQQDEKSDVRFLWVHCGVAASRKELCLEQRAFNDLDFRCPDERGWSPVQQCINGDDGPREKCLECPIDLTKICERLKGNYPVNVSQDAGRFLCNMIYYLSLREASRRRHHVSLFVHVPTFEVVSEEKQREFMVKLLNELIEATRALE